MQFDPYAAFRPSFAEGGTVEEAPVPAPQSSDLLVPGLPEEMTDGDRQLLELGAAAITGRLPEAQADEVMQQFISLFGIDVWRALRDKLLSDDDPTVTTEGLVDGVGGGMDDMVDMSIGDNKHAAAVSPSEYIVPADVVAALGDGSSDAGSKKLDKMMERVRVAKTGSTGQPPPINSRKVMAA